MPGIFKSKEQKIVAMPSPFRRKTLACLPLLLCLFAMSLAACRQEEKTGPGRIPSSPPVQDAPQVSRPAGCQGCHSAVRLDAAHDLACSQCHGGTEKAAGRDEAHAGLSGQPAHPDQMRERCGGCHADQVRAVADSAHFTLKNEVNLVRAAFGAGQELARLTEIPLHATIDSPLALADDLLRRRCLACHPYSQGDTYPETVRGTGCAACHLLYENGGQKSHAFTKSPPDSQCLHCHYGNRVGADYHGRFEHDFGVEYRTPYRSDGSNPRPHGVEYHQLAPDLHQRAGLACIDCHSGAELMGGHGASAPGKKLTCRTCHAWRPGTPLPLNNLQTGEGGLRLLTRLSGKNLAVPPLAHPAHQRYAATVDCAVCHSQWSFNDRGTHLIRYDALDGEPWEDLAVQGSFEVEEQLNYGSADTPLLRDRLNNTATPGIWLMGYELRRWELPLIGPDAQGRLRVFRPILDLHLSLVDDSGKVVFDNAEPIEGHPRYLPYTPHTTGKAGAFYHERLKTTLPPEHRQ